MKRYYVRDNDDEYEVEEIEEQSDATETPAAASAPAEAPAEGAHDAETLTDEEIAALKGLAKVADKLIAMIGTTDSCSDKDEEEEEEMHDENEEEEEEEEEIVDTDEENSTKTCDSKKSFGAIERKTTKTEDSVEDAMDIDAAWAKRYGGK
jgi:hypothetical protein